MMSVFKKCKDLEIFCKSEIITSFNYKKMESMLYIEFQEHGVELGCTDSTKLYFLPYNNIANIVYGNNDKIKIYCKYFFGHGWD